ncbi:hypothetical protein GGU11DRAFT_756848 [Lentinula aff. detonsa]|nr:hypothetical protein GGU11DRAFT_756848 [Lentinula aff. detonsa]
MASYRELLVGLKDEPPQSNSSYKGLLDDLKDKHSQSASPAGNHRPQLHWPAHSTALSSNSHTPSELPSTQSSFQEIQTEITKQTVRSMLTSSAHASSAEQFSLESLLIPDHKNEGRFRFGDSTRRDLKTTRTLILVSSLTKAACQLENQLTIIASSQTAAEIQSILCAVEDRIETIRHQLSSVTGIRIPEEAKQVVEILDAVELSVEVWRREYPDTSPVKLDNRKHFLDPGQNENTPTLIAYCLALTLRVFERTAQRGASFILKMIKLFGYSFGTLGGRTLNTEQEVAMARIPESIRTLEKRFNLDVECILYAVCPKCSCTYNASYPNDPSQPVYPTTCREGSTSSKAPCDTPLLSFGKPIKTFEYYPFFDWFSRFIALPGIEEYGDKFCEIVASHQTSPVQKTDSSDGRFVLEFRGEDGQLFVADRQNEGRWFFCLNADFFNVEGNRIRGKASSTGMMAMSCLNLPLEMRNDHAYLYVPGIIQGPHEPNAVNAEHRHYLKPLVNDLLAGYTRGVRPYATHRTHTNKSTYNRTFRIALASILMDFKATRPFAAHLGRTDYENWRPANDAFLKKGAMLWRDATEVKDRKAIEDLFGTRFSELWRLPYWRPTHQIAIDPMHTFFLILLQRMFRDILGLDNPDDPKRTPKKPKYKFAFYHDFTPPPPLSSLALNSSELQEDARRPWTNLIDYQSQPSDGHQLSSLDWPHLTAEHRNCRKLRLDYLKTEIASDIRAFQSVKNILNDLSGRAPGTPAEERKWYARIQKHKWNAILYVCDNLVVFPNEKYPAFQTRSQIVHNDVKKGELTNMLLSWRMNGIKEIQSFVWPHFTPTSTPPPVVPWASSQNSNNGHEPSTTYRKFSPEERLDLLTELAASMSYHSASHLGNIHRLLQRPLVKGQEDDLRKALKQSNGDALAHVCTDIGRLPAGKIVKDDMVNQLMTWRMSKPLEQMQSVKLDSSGLLKRIQQVIREAVTPAWVTNPPPDVGLAKAGTLKAEHWRTLFAIHVPLAVLSLWNEGSPLASPDAQSMTSVMETIMYLTCASLIMTKHTLSADRRNLYRHLLRLHVLGLKKDFPGWIFPTHHLAFHIFEGMDLFSGVRHWWLFPFERLIGKLQRIPTNHITGQFEHTMQHSFYKGSNYRQYLLRPNSPPILRYCQQLLDKAYNYDHRPSPPSIPSPSNDDVDDYVDLPAITANIVTSNFAEPNPKDDIPTPSGLKKLLEVEPFQCFSRIPGPEGDYTIPSEGTLGSSYICFQPGGDYTPGQQWQAGQIQYIFRRTYNDPIQVAIRQSLPSSEPHPFANFWPSGFEAQMVSSKFMSALKIVDLKQIAGHTARWTINDDWVAVINLCSVTD